MQPSTAAMKEHEENKKEDTKRRAAKAKRQLILQNSLSLSLSPHDLFRLYSIFIFEI